MDKASNTIGIIIVTYKSYDRIQEYVNQDLRPSGTPRKIVVVDVGSRKESALKIAALLGVEVSNFEEAPAGDVVVLHVEENLGYARGNNYGVRYIMAHFPEVNMFLFSNDDVRFTKGDVLGALSSKLSEIPEASVIGPDIVDTRGGHQGPTYTHPSLFRTIFNNITEPLFGRDFANRIFNPHPHERVSGPVCILSGCFLMVKKDDFIEAGMFDERTFLYWEEEILCKRMEAIGKYFYYEDSVQIRHLQGAVIHAGGGPKMLPLKHTIAGGNLFYRCYEQHNPLALLALKISNGFRLAIVYLVIQKWKLKALLKNWGRKTPKEL